LSHAPPAVAVQLAQQALEGVCVEGRARLLSCASLGGLHAGHYSLPGSGRHQHSQQAAPSLAAGRLQHAVQHAAGVTLAGHSLRHAGSHA
jgi:hypothetical protein